MNDFIDRELNYIMAEVDFCEVKKKLQVPFVEKKNYTRYMKKQWKIGQKFTLGKTHISIVKIIFRIFKN